MEKMNDDVSIKIKNFINEFNKKKKLEKISYILGIVFLILFILSALYLLWILIDFFIKSFFNNFILSLSYDLTKPQAYFFLFLSIFWIAFTIYYTIIVILLKKEIKFNWYVIVGIHLCFFLLIFGISFVNQNYGSEFTSGFSFKEYNANDFKNENCSISRISCWSLGKYNKWVINDKIICEFNISENCPFELESVDLDKTYTNDSKIRSNQYSSNYFDFFIEKDLKYIFIYPQFINRNYSEEDMSIFWTDIYFYNRYEDEEYRKTEYEKTFLIITIISLSIFTTIIGMNNLKQLLQKSNSSSTN